MCLKSEAPMRCRGWAALLAAVILSGCGASQKMTAPAQPTAGPGAEGPAADAGHIARADMLRCLYYDDRDFHIYDENSVIYETNGAVLCGVAPHHLAAGELIAGMYRTAAASRNKTDTVVLIAPMHYDSDCTLTTSRRDWQTAFGTVTNDTGLTDMFIDRLGAKEDDYMTEYDHSASSHIPFIKRYLPDAEVACLLVSPKEYGDIPQRLSKLLCEMSEIKDCFFAFSIDFSHYLDPDDAERHDAETRQAVLSADTASIAHFTNSNVDTPYCLGTFVRLAGALGADITDAAHSNTWRIGSVPYSRTVFPEGVTSYFVFLAADK